MAEYWLTNLDIDGYRMDCAFLLEDRYPGFSLILKNCLAAIKPDIFLLAEGNVNEGRFFNNGYNSAYDWDLRGSDTSGIPALFSGLKTAFDVHNVLTRSLPANGQPFRFAENHDYPRAASLWGVNGSIVAHTIVLTSRGYPDVFGGAEVGFAPAMTHPYSENDPIVWDFNAPIYSYFKKLIAVRNQYLKSDLQQYWINNDSSVIYSSLSVSGTNRLIVLANCTNESRTAVLSLTNAELGTISSLTELISGTNVIYSGGGTLTVTLGGYETAIYLVR